MRNCVTCGREISDEEFSSYDDRSQREYGISGMCLDPCQDSVFNYDGGCWCGGDHDEWDDDIEGLDD